MGILDTHIPGSRIKGQLQDMVQLYINQIYTRHQPRGLPLGSPEFTPDILEVLQRQVSEVPEFAFLGRLQVADLEA